MLRFVLAGGGAYKYTNLLSTKLGMKYVDRILVTTFTTFALVCCNCSKKYSSPSQRLQLMNVIELLHSSVSGICFHSELHGKQNLFFFFFSLFI